MTKQIPKSYWYAIRIKPGYQRMASHNHSLPETRAGESVVERNLRNEGIDVYMPSYWVEVIHHRKKTIIERRFPLLVGYAFVNLPALNFETVRKVEGVMCLLKINRERGPISFDERAISMLIAADFEARQEYLYTQHSRKENDRQDRILELRKSLRSILPKGRALRLSMMDQAWKVIESLKPSTKERVLTVINELKDLTGEDPLANRKEIA